MECFPEKFVWLSAHEGTLCAHCGNIWSAIGIRQGDLEGKNYILGGLLFDIYIAHRYNLSANHDSPLEEPQTNITREMLLMFDRKAVKEAGRGNMMKHYWLAVLAGFLAVVFTLASSGASSQNDDVFYIAPDTVIYGSILVGAVVGLVIELIVVVFLVNPVKLGSAKWFLNNGREGNAKAEYLVYGFNAPYMNKVMVLFGRTWRILLWSLLFIIPGIVKMYQYRLVPYIVCDDPEISTEDALLKSEEMMYGSKWAAFVLDLSFIGWGLLSILTLGLLQIFFVVPYKCATNAELYEVLREQYDQI